MTRKTPSPTRLRARTFGQMAETAAMILLRLKGYRILARQFVCPMGEIDIIAKRADIVAFVEVKGRGDTTTAAYSIGASQRRRITRAAEAFLQKNPDLSQGGIRFDAILIAPWRWPMHITEAWRADGI